MPSSAKPTVVSLFSGAGGLDIGLEQAGWTTVAATDHDKSCCATLTASQRARIPVRGRRDAVHLAGTAIVQADIADLRASDLRPPRCSVDWRPALVAGGPPCQPWSSAGLQGGFSDPRGQVLQHFIRLIDELRPHLVFMENVRGLVTAVGRSGKPGEALRWIQACLSDIGYASTLALVNAADYGAAQRRVRLLLIASSDHRLPSFPEPTHKPVSEPGQLAGRAAWLSLGEALRRLPAPADEDIVRPKGERAQQLADLPPGTGLRTSGRVESNRPGGHWGYRQDCFVADLSLPARTIRAASTPDWIREDDGRLRRLTWRECAALQGFHAGWQFAGSAASRFRQIGNAVQAAVAEAVGLALIDALDTGPSDHPPRTHPWPVEFDRRVRYTVAEHRVNGEHRVRVRASV